MCGLNYDLNVFKPGFATPGGYRKFLGCLGQLAPATLPQRRLVSNLSLYGPLSVCASFSSPSQGGISSSSPSQGGFSSFSPPPTGFYLSLSSLVLCLILPPPPLLAHAT